MEKNIVILGSSGFAKEILFLIERINQQKKEWNILGFIDENIRKKVGGYEVIGNDDFLCKYDKEIAVVCGVGNPFLRKKIVRKLKNNRNLYFPNIIDPSVILSSNVEMGEGNIICAGTILTVDIIMGDFVTINLDCTIGHDAVINSYVSIYPSVNVSGNVKIESGVEIGTGTNIIQGIHIGRQTVIGAGSVVIRDVEGNCTVVGNPGRVIERN